MITTLDFTPWSCSVLTGNGQLAIDQNNNFWIVSNVREDNTFIILMSTDVGYTWTQMAEYSFSQESPARLNKYFDPAVCIDIDGVLQIIGAQPSASARGFDIVHFSFNTIGSPPVLTGPTPIVTSETVASDYDIVALADGTCGIAVSVIDPVFPSGMYEQLSPPELVTIAGNVLLYGILNNEVFNVDQIIDISPFNSGNTFGSVTLYTPDQVVVELYYNSHPKGITFADIVVTVWQTVRSGGSLGTGVWEPVIELQQYQCRWTDDRLTVSGYASNRYISQGYYTYAAHFGLSGHLLLGSTADGVNWRFQPILGTPTASLLYPTLSVSVNPTSPPTVDLTLGYLVWNLTNQSTTGKFKLAAVDPVLLNLLDVPGTWNTQSFTWLRGTQDIIDPVSEWIVIGERNLQPFGSPPFVNAPSIMSGYNKPPIAVLIPSTATLQRNTTITLDASESSDPDLDPIQFTWSVNGVGSPPSDVSQVLLTPSADGRTATVSVPNAIGPAELQFEVQVACVDLDINGNPIHTPAVGRAIADSLITVPFDAAPMVLFNPPIEFTGSPAEWTLAGQPRNAVVSITPIVVPGLPSDVITYSWSQIAGNPVNILSAANAATLVFQTNGVDIHGDTAMFQLVVSDGVNFPVQTDILVDIDEYNFTELDSFVLSRSIWGSSFSPAIEGTIFNRNNDAGWQPVQKSLYLSNMQAVKRNTALVGDDRVLYISPYSILILGDASTNVTADDAVADVPLGPLFAFTPLMIRRLFAPALPCDIIPSAPTEAHPLWVDAIHTEDDYTICLDRNMFLYRYSTAPLVNTDNPDAVILLPNLTTFTFNAIFCTPSFNNKRILVLSGPDGLILLQIVNSTFVVSGFMEITTANNLLYGAADNVQWVRANNVESIASGQVLIGTVDSSGNTFETYVDLPHRTILGTWDKSKLKNPTVDTGEFLFGSAEGYAGLLQSPFITDASSDSQGNITLVWTQIRTDLVNYYTIQYSVDGGQNWQELVAIGSGVVTTYSFLGNLGLTYSFRMNATNNDGTSAYSNIVTVYNEG